MVENSVILTLISECSCRFVKQSNCIYDLKDSDNYHNNGFEDYSDYSFDELAFVVVFNSHRFGQTERSEVTFPFVLQK